MQAQRKSRSDKGLKKRLKTLYAKLYRAYGPQRWWPARTRFEVILGAILTQNTSWSNVEKAIANLRSARLLNAPAIHKLGIDELAQRIKPSGYYNLKAKRLKAFLNHLYDNYGGDLDKMLGKRTDLLRAELLAINGIGPETADTILLYAAKRPVFVIDAYTKRVLTYHGLAGKDDGYDELQRLFMDNLEHNAELFNEYHALIVRVAKEHCKARSSICKLCPLDGLL